MTFSEFAVKDFRKSLTSLGQKTWQEKDACMTVVDHLNIFFAEF